MNREQILDEAKKCVLIDRNKTHGDPEDNFALISGLWTEYLRSIKKPALITPISSTDVATMMILMKVSRLVTSPKNPDHWIDIAGYAACGGGISTAEPESLTDLQKEQQSSLKDVPDSKLKSWST